MTTISEKIIALRKSHNLTQEALGEAVGVSGQAVSKWEKGDSLPDISIIPDLCKVFNISADTLLGNEGNVSPQQYLEKALASYKGHSKTELLHDAFVKITAPDFENFAADNPLNTRLDTFVSVNDYVLVSDSRGFGAYIDSDQIKRICEFDYSKAVLLNIMTDIKTLKIFTLICSSDGLTQPQIIKSLDYDENVVENILFKLMKYNIIQSAKNNLDGELVFIINEHGSFLLMALAAIALAEPEFRNKISSTGITINHQYK
jgi:transcriptional regulator with XRE-family HTH domain